MVAISQRSMLKEYRHDGSHLNMIQLDVDLYHGILFMFFMMVLMCRFLARLLASPGSSSSPAAPQTSKTKHWLKNGSKRSTQVITGQQNLPAFVRPEVYTKAQGDLHAAFAAVENLSIRGFQHVPTVKTHVNNC